MSDNRFSLTRATAFIPVELKCFHKKIFLYTCVMAAVLIFLALVSPLGNVQKIDPYGVDPSYPALLGNYMAFLFIFGFISASLMWSELKNKEGRIYSIMTPASDLEKFIVKFFIYVFCFIIVYILSVCIAETIRYIVYHSVYPDASVKPLYLAFQYPENVRNDIWDLWRVHMQHPVLFTFFLFMASQSFFVLGSIVWPARSFTKTFLVFSGIGVAYIIIAVRTAIIFHRGNPDEAILSWIDNHTYLFYGVIATIVCILNWTLAYFRTRETDVITVKR